MIIDEDDTRMVIGDLGQGIEAVDGRDHFATHVFQQRFGGCDESSSSRR